LESWYNQGKITMRIIDRRTGALMADNHTIPIDPLLLLDYMYWGHDRAINGARQLSAAQLTAPIRPGFLSTLALLVHIMGAERLWLSRWQGESPKSLLTVRDIPSLDALVTAWEPLRAEMRAFVLGMDDPDREVIYRRTNGEEKRNVWWHVFMHVVNHGTEHRSQVALYLAMQGIDVGNLDLIEYLRRPS
jgi:uncharacterized damage-inducible protein DinB